MCCGRCAGVISATNHAEDAIFTHLKLDMTCARMAIVLRASRAGRERPRAQASQSARAPGVRRARYARHVDIVIVFRERPHNEAQPRVIQAYVQVRFSVAASRGAVERGVKTKLVKGVSVGRLGRHAQTLQV